MTPDYTQHNSRVFSVAENLGQILSLNIPDFAKTARVNKYKFEKKTHQQSQSHLSGTSADSHLREVTEEVPCLLPSREWRFTIANSFHIILPFGCLSNK